MKLSSMLVDDSSSGASCGCCQQTVVKPVAGGGVSAVDVVTAPLLHCHSIIEHIKCSSSKSFKLVI